MKYYDLLNLHSLTVVNSLDTPFNTYNNPRSLHIANLFGDVNRIIIRDNEIFISVKNQTKKLLSFALFSLGINIK